MRGSARVEICRWPMELKTGTRICYKDLEKKRFRSVSKKTLLGDTDVDAAFFFLHDFSWPHRDLTLSLDHTEMRFFRFESPQILKQNRTLSLNRKEKEERFEVSNIR
jgi:hypothetical protein